MVLSLGTAWAAPEDSGRESSVPVVKVTWVDLLRLVDQHPRLAAGRLQVEAARGGVDAASAVPNPSVEGTVGLGQARVGHDSRIEWSAALTVPLEWLTRRGPVVAAAVSTVQLASAERNGLRQAVLLNLQDLFWNLAYEQMRVATLEALEAEHGVLVRTVRARVDKGESRPVEVTRVEIELEKVTSEVEAARTLMATRQGQLALWIGVPKGAPIVAVADLTAIATISSPRPWLNQASATQPSVLTARAHVRVAEAEVEVEKSARRPSFALTGYTAHELDRRAYGIGIAVELPLFNWNSGRLTQAKAKLEAERKETEAVALDAEAAIIEAAGACRASAQAATRIHTQVLPRAVSATTTLERAYQLGEVSLLELIDARRTLLDAHSLDLTALTRAQQDCGRLNVLTREDMK